MCYVPGLAFDLWRQKAFVQSSDIIRLDLSGRAELLLQGNSWPSHAGRFASLGASGEGCANSGATPRSPRLRGWLPLPGFDWGFVCELSFCIYCDSSVLAFNLLFNCCAAKFFAGVQYRGIAEGSSRPSHSIAGAHFSYL